MQSNEKEPGPLLKELDALYKDIHSRLEGASFLGKSMAQKLAPIEKILVFVGKVVKKVESLEDENAFLKSELSKINEELAKQNTIIKDLDNGIVSSERTRKELGITP